MGNLTSIEETWRKEMHGGKGCDEMLPGDVVDMSRGRVRIQIVPFSVRCQPSTFPN